MSSRLFYRALMSSLLPRLQMATVWRGTENGRRDIKAWAADISVLSFVNIAGCGTLEFYYNDGAALRLECPMKLPVLVDMGDRNADIIGR